MDKVTAMTIDKGKKNERLLVQPLHETMSVEKQVAILYCGTNGLLANVPLDKVQEFESIFLNSLELNHQKDVLDVIKSGKIDDDVVRKIKLTAEETIKQIKK
jgi:F-type H+-transporting ATPase subunit alpha